MDNPVMYVVKHLNTTTPYETDKPQVISEPLTQTVDAQLLLIKWATMYPWYKYKVKWGNGGYARIVREHKTVGDIPVWDFTDMQVLILDENDNFICSISIWSEDILSHSFNL